MDLYLSPSIRFLFNNNRVIVFNRRNGSWMKISRECYDILKNSIDNQSTEEELLDSLADDEDKLYFKKLLDNLHELSSETEKKHNKINDVSISITKRCNLECMHCIVDADKVNNHDKYTTSQVFQIIDKVKALKPSHITLTGGEPMIRDDFVDILKHTSSNYDGKISVMTNGTLINTDNVKPLAALAHNIDISIDGADEESCSIIRGKGVFQQVVNSIKLLHKNDYKKISLSMVLTKNNQNVVNKFYKLNEELGTKPMLRQLALLGRAERNSDILTQFVSNAQEISSPSELKNKHEIIGCSCKAGVNELTIEYNGDIFPCDLFTDEQFKLGNVDEIEDLRILFEEKNEIACTHSCLSDFEPDQHPLCCDCNVNFFCWRCLHDLYILENNIDLFKERCDYMKPHLNELLWE
ncbi:radical SAM protein [Tissierella sp. MB52-C2]|uniref:radical SAM/SPASM domain-containing protein n=1 Tax=Tissierella sp. MB52-C2 TaxID=3070999 RepID=UPI00280A80EF|nr:radical SAM protein [Tissierella sp. MB52-C2]WMM26568.1 radical SAM protein [Tissierella sp. MB52-C2]